MTAPLPGTAAPAAQGPGSKAYRMHTSLPGGTALPDPNRLPSRKRGSPRPPSRGPASVLAAASAVGPVLHRRRRRTPPSLQFAAFRAASGVMDGPRLGGRGDERGAKARAERTAGAPQTSRNGMCESGRIGIRGDDLLPASSRTARSADPGPQAAWPRPREATARPRTGRGGRRVDGLMPEPATAYEPRACRT